MLSVPPPAVSPRSILGCANVLVEMREREVLTAVKEINPRYVRWRQYQYCLSQTSFLANFQWPAGDCKHVEIH